MSQDNSEELNGQDSGANDLSEALGGSEDSFVVPEEKQPMSRSTLMMFAVLVMGAVGFYVMYRQSGPKAAAAAVTRETADAKKTISTFLSGTDNSFKSMEERLKNTEKVVQRFLKYPSATQVPLSDLATNPFRQHTQQAVKSSGNPDLSEAAEKKKREEERLAIKKAAESMQVQSIVSSDTRKACMINNTIYREGQSINDFTIEKISPTAVIIKNGPYRFELRMQR